MLQKEGAQLALANQIKLEPAIVAPECTTPTPASHRLFGHAGEVSRFRHGERGIGDAGGLQEDGGEGNELRRCWVGGGTNTTGTR
jgi:hypothetical protein